jgi:hypothetical protein
LPCIPPQGICVPAKLSAVTLGDTFQPSAVSFQFGSRSCPRLNAKLKAESCFKNENARGRNPWRLHIVRILRSAGCPSPSLRRRPTPTLFGVPRLWLAPSADLRFASKRGSFSSFTGGQRPAFAVRRSFRFARLVTLWLAPERSIFRLGLSIGVLLSQPANPSAHVSELSFRLSPALPSSEPPGWQPPRSRGTAHLPARLAVSFQLRPDFHRRLAPPVSIRSALSPHPRNCISGDFRSSSAFSSAK